VLHLLGELGRGYEMKFKKQTKFFNSSKIIFQLLTVTIFMISIFGKAWGQLSANTPGTPQDWKRVFGFSDIFPGKLNEILKAEFNLTDEQVEAINELAALDRQYAQREAHDSSESVPWKSEDKNFFITNFETKTLKLKNSLGAEKFEDLCQWVDEEEVIKWKISQLVSENTNLSNTSYYSDQLFNEITNSDFYKNYKQKKDVIFNSKNKTDNYFSKYEKGLKLRISYELSLYGRPARGDESIAERRREGKERLNNQSEIFNEMKELY
jgi:hypothetical protein